MADKKEDKSKKEEAASEESKELEDIVEEEKEDEAKGKEQDYNSIFDEDYVDEKTKEREAMEEDEESAEEKEMEEEEAAEETEAKEEKSSKEKSKESSKKSSEKKEDKKEKKPKEDEEKLDAEDEIHLKEEKPKKKGKGLPKKKILVVLAIALALLAGAYGGYLYFKSQNKEEPQTQTVTEEPKKEETKKTVYVTAEGGLNMRKEPDSNSEVIAVIPNGTKLDVLEEQGEWYKVEYEGQEGWIWQEYTSDESPLVYKNETYGFQLTFPENWADYKIVKKDVDNGDGTSSPVLYVGIKVSDPNYDSTVGKGYADMFAISVFTNDEWATVEAGEGPKPSYITKNDKYVFASSPSQAGPDEVTDERAQMNDILATFKIL